MFSCFVHLPVMLTSKLRLLNECPSNVTVPMEPAPPEGSSIQSHIIQVPCLSLVGRLPIRVKATDWDWPCPFCTTGCFWKDFLPVHQEGQPKRLGESKDILMLFS